MKRWIPSYSTCGLELAISNQPIQLNFGEKEIQLNFGEKEIPQIRSKALSPLSSFGHRLRVRTFYGISGNLE
jgi:hypothetical protein